MASTLNADNGAISGSSGLKNSGDASGVLALQTNGTTALTIDTSQKVGIGTSSPEYKLDVVGATGAIRVQPSTNTNSAYSVYQNAGNILYFGVDNSSGTDFGAAYSACIATTGAYPFTFRVNGNERMRIDSSGNLLVGTTSTYGQKLSINGGIQMTRGNLINFSDSSALNNLISGDTNNNLVFWTAGTQRVAIDSSGNVLIGTTTSIGSANVCVKSGGIGQSFYRTDTTAFSPLAFYSNTSTLQGYITCTGAGATSYITTSDQRLKENITDAPNSLNIINSIKVRSFDWKESKVHQDFGFVAQELIEIAPDAVAVNQDEFKTMGVDASKLVPYLVKAIQELKAEVDSLKAQLNK